MGTQRARLEAWFPRSRGPREPQLEAELLAVADAYDAAQESGTLTSQQLNLVAAAAGHPRAFVWTEASHLLKELSGRWPEAAEAILQMSKSGKAHIRFSAICSVGIATPSSVADAVLLAGLRDKSGGVRWKAAAKIEHLSKTHLLPQLTAALAVEEDEKARRGIEHHLRLLRDGHILEPMSKGRFVIWVRIPDGSASRIIDSTELNTRGLDAIISELRR